MQKAILNLQANCVAVSVSTMISHSAMGIVERAARKKNIRIFWSKHF